MYFYNGIYVDGINISGLSKETAVKKLQKEKKFDYKDKIIYLIYKEKKWPIPLDSIKYKPDFDSTLNYAYNIGRKGSIVQRLNIINSLNRKPINLILSYKYDKNQLVKKLEVIKKDIDFLGISSTYNYNYGKINYTADVTGRKLDVDTNLKLIETYLLNRNFEDINLVVQPVKPSITLEDVKELEHVLASYTTSFNINNYSRASNIKLACQKINNYLLLPGEEFSLDLVLGPRTTAHGYMEAPIIMKNSVVQGTGGGVCQVASTLYNAVLFSMLQVTSRINHSITLNYVPPGQDATISEGYIDFKFKNNRDYTVCIVAEVDKGNLTVKIIGRKRINDPIVKLRPVIIEEYEPPHPEYVIDDSLSDNQVVIRTKEKKGMKVVLYRDSYNSQGLLINTEKISQDIYKPVRGVLAVNKKSYNNLKIN
ncbi:VanW family protein [Ruminiclostridium herbifermentans]|uniref:VanW family protein n=2 Tax=Ruminiclostridium herbifermentans TaxID=2488810 RepID=A0A7H1VIR4_9FIRM|nr:VanW family protein [Ruminiclostridium herbifermentans]